VRDYIMATTATNILDWRSCFGFDAPLAVYAGIAVPSLVTAIEAGWVTLR